MAKIKYFDIFQSLVWADSESLRNPALRLYFTVGYLNSNNELEFPFFLSITEDYEGNLWMITYNNGVFKYNWKGLIHCPVKAGETDVLLFTIFKDHKRALWLGSQNAGVFKFNGNAFDKMF